MCIKKIIKTKCDSVVSVHEINDFHPLKAKKIVDDILIPFHEDFKESNFRRQDLSPAYRRNGGIYLNTRKMVMSYNSCHGTKGICRPYIMPLERSVDINNLIDFHIAEIMISKKSKK
jgi:CMP-N,N'-diacetyllegionaminic acid synthase